jgi:hypothetical protein
MSTLQVAPLFKKPIEGVPVKGITNGKPTNPEAGTRVIPPSPVTLFKEMLAAVVGNTTTASFAPVGGDSAVNVAVVSETLSRFPTVGAQRRGGGSWASWSVPSLPLSRTDKRSSAIADMSNALP